MRRKDGKARGGGMKKIEEIYILMNFLHIVNAIVIIQSKVKMLLLSEIQS